MAVVKPFRGLRPKPEFATRVASPPYDVLSSDEARAMAKDNPLSFLHVVKPEIDLDPSTHIYDEGVYLKGAENLRKLIKDGIMVQDAEPCYYVYTQKMGGHTQTGLVASASVEDYIRDIIKKHEHTRPDKENDRARHVETLNANTGPVFLTYKSTASVDALLEAGMSDRPVYHFTADDGVEHTFYVIDRPELIEKIERAFAGIDFLYVADGHHRSAAGTRVGRERKKRNAGHTGGEEYNFFLSVIFPHDRMKIMGYNRVVRDLAGMEKEDFLRRVEKCFTLTGGAAPEPDAPRTYGMYLDGAWYRLTALDGTYPADDPVESLDVSILQNNLLESVLGISDPRTDKRIDFVGGIRGSAELERLVDSSAYHVAFACFPTSIEQLMRVADSGRVMPPKSTWFEPKLRSGLVVHLLD
jgi:uncharacterized protein (DUF1015 family)